MSEKRKVKVWLGAMRLRTLPLALSSTVTGVACAALSQSIDWPVAGMSALTTVLLQINSNLANDYGDFQHGTDNAQRVGPMRTLQSGALQPAQVYRAMVLFSALSLVSGMVLLWLAPISWGARGVLFAAGLAAIYASLRYTAGANPYGYRGLGDLSVMVFFGVLGVAGAYYLQCDALSPWVLLPAIGIGAASAGVLNVNNVRDLKADQDAGKITLAVRLGPRGARRYHIALLVLAGGSFLTFAMAHFDQGVEWLFVLALPIWIANARSVYTRQEPKQLDPLLKQLALGTFFLAVLFAIGIALGNLA